jgi:hypothetical protein
VPRRLLRLRPDECENHRQSRLSVRTHDFYLSQSAHGTWSAHRGLGSFWTSNDKDGHQNELHTRPRVPPVPYGNLCRREFQFLVELVAPVNLRIVVGSTLGPRQHEGREKLPLAGV